MIGLMRAAYVIARRDYVATVWSKTFLILLIAPLLPALLGLAMAGLGGGRDHGDDRRGGIALATDGATATALIAARDRLNARIGRDFVPALIADRAPPADAPRLDGTLDRPHLTAPPAALRDLGGSVALLVDEARAARALGDRLPPRVALRTTATAAPPADDDRIDVARGGQLVLFLLTILLAGMMISNMVEEKANKVIESLAAAVPVDAIFLGKLLAILAASLTGLLLWGGLGVAALIVWAPTLPAPAVGWPWFVLLAVAYFVTVFLLWGALYLGLGAQAGSAREAQTLSMPLTLGEAFAYVFASAEIAHPDRPIGLGAALVPWSSPFAMIGRAAMRAELWPHLLALGWQISWILLSIRVGARLFRTNILKSGGRRWFGRRAE